MAMRAKMRTRTRHDAMTGEVAVIREQGQTFVVLAVKPHVVQSPTERQQRVAASREWFGVRTALLAEDGRTWGPNDIVRWLQNIHPGQLPWRKFTV
jgi:hypothetical protein